MKRFLLCAALALAVPIGGCHSFTSLPTSPSNAANATVLDEQLALGVEATYKAARTAMETAVDSGVLHGANATKARTLNTQAYDAVKATRAAYDAGQQDNYIAAAGKAAGIVSNLLAVTAAAKGSN